MFKDYVDTFLKLKVENSGLPEWVKNESGEKKYRELYKEHEVIQLGPIQKNTGMRWLAKLLLNSSWGKFGQRPNLPMKILVSSMQELWTKLNDTSIEYTLCHMDDDAAELLATNKEDYVDNGVGRNVCIAAYTTAQARLKLYSYLELLGERERYIVTQILSCT